MCAPLFEAILLKTQILCCRLSFVFAVVIFIAAAVLLPARLTISLIISLVFVRCIAACCHTIVKLVYGVFSFIFINSNF